MLTHIVWWTFKDEALGRNGKENAVLAKQALEALCGRIPELKTLTVGTDVLAGSTEEAALVLVTRHDDAAGLAAYAAHPEHQKVVEFIKQVVATRRALDFQD